MKRGHEREGRTTRLLDQLGPEGRVGENPTSSDRTYPAVDWRAEEDLKRTASDDASTHTLKI